MTPTIGDRLKIALSPSCAISIGSVFRLRLTENDGITLPNNQDSSRNKFCIIIGKNDCDKILAFLLINTYINPGLPLLLRNLHYEIKASDYEFIEGRNRFVDCAQIKEMSMERFDELFRSNDEKGKINNTDLELIIGAVKSSPKTSPSEIRRYNL